MCSSDDRSICCFNRCNEIWNVCQFFSSQQYYLSLRGLIANDVVNEQTRYLNLPRVNVSRNLHDTYWDELNENYILAPCQCGYFNETKASITSSRKKLQDFNSHPTVSRAVNLHLRTVATAIQTVRPSQVVCPLEMLTLESSLLSRYAISGLAIVAQQLLVKLTATQTY